MTVRLDPDRVIVLDVDDTLYLERDYVRSGFVAVGELVSSQLGIDGIGHTLWSGFVAGVRGDAFDRALLHHGCEPSPDLIRELVDCYRAHRPAIHLLPDAARLLDRLAGRRLAAITDGPVNSQRAKVEALGLEARADPVVLTGELGPGRSKPDPAAYVLVEQHSGLDPDRHVYIGDNPTKDFVTPLDRGWTPVRIRRPDSLHHDAPTPAGVLEISSLDEIID